MNAWQGKDENNCAFSRKVKGKDEFRVKWEGELLPQIHPTFSSAKAHFEDLVRIFVSLRSLPLRGRHVGIVSNAGFECVAMADGLGDLELAKLGPATREQLADIFRRLRLEIGRAHV